MLATSLAAPTTKAELSKSRLEPSPGEQMNRLAPQYGNQALLRGFGSRAGTGTHLAVQPKLTVSAPYLARQTAAPAQDPIEQSFKTEVEKELEEMPARAADPKAPKQLTLKASDQAYVKSEIIQGAVYSQANKGVVPMTGEKTHDATLIAEHFLCTWTNSRVAGGQPRLQPDPLFCDDPAVTAAIMKSDDVRNDFTEKYIYPAYDAAVAEAQKQGAVTQNQGMSTVRPDATKSADPAEQADLVLFAENLHAEAGLEADAIGPKALEAVAQVVLNRMACTGQSARSNILKQGQFSWVNPSNPVHDQRNPKNTRVWNQCVEVSVRALNGGVDGGVDGADHYFSTAIDPPSWANEDCFVAQVGKHKFYKLSCLGTVCAKPQP